MTDDDKFFERLRADAQMLRYDASDVVLTRLAARVDERVRVQPPVAQLLAAWFRPVAVSLAALSLVAALGVSWIEQSREPATVEAAVAANDQPLTFEESLGVE